MVALRSIDADARKRLNASTRTVVNPIWQGAVKSRASTPMDSKVLATGSRVAVGARPALVAASSTRPLRGGFVPGRVRAWAAWEFGSDAQALKRTYQTRSRRGRAYEMTRRTRRQVPHRAQDGRVLYPAVADTGPRVFALWAQTTIRSIFEAFEKGAS